VSSPIVSDKVEKALRDIGLTEYESLAYLSLLRSGELTAENVSDASSIPYSKVYGVLDNLHEKGWIETEGGRPRRYYPRSPEDALRSMQLRLEAGFEENRDIIVQDLQPLFEQKEVREMPEIWMVRGEKNTLDKVVELVGKARKEIMFVLPWTPVGLLPTISLMAEAQDLDLQRIFDSKIEIKVLTTKDAVKAIDKQYLALAEVRVCEELFGGGLVVDGRESLLFLDLALPRGPDLAIWSAHESLTRISTTYFQHLWDNAEPYEP
jgi:sugar-specific transcriptional regulator TrmB